MSRLRIVGLAVLAVLVVGAFALGPREQLLAFLAALRGTGPAGWLVFGVAYVLVTVLLLPASVLTIGAGFLWGPVVGALVVWPSAMIAATAAFLLGRTALRGVVEARAAREPKFAAVDRAISRDGFRLVLLLRLSPIFPFNLLNYGLGITGIPLGSHTVATAFGMLPGTLLYVWLGSTVSDLGALAQGAPDAGFGGRALSVLGLVATLVATVFVTRKAQAALREELERA